MCERPAICHSSEEAIEPPNQATSAVAYLEVGLQSVSKIITIFWADSFARRFKGYAKQARASREKYGVDPNATPKP